VVYDPKNFIGLTNKLVGIGVTIDDGNGTILAGLIVFSIPNTTLPNDGVKNTLLVLTNTEFSLIVKFVPLTTKSILSLLTLIYVSLTYLSG